MIIRMKCGSGRDFNEVGNLQNFPIYHGLAPPCNPNLPPPGQNPVDAHGWHNNFMNFGYSKA